MLLLTMRGTSFIYQCQEIGMTNFPFKNIDEFKDVEVKGNLSAVHEKGASSATYLSHLKETARDHESTPKQWSGDWNSGFSQGKNSWLTVNPNYIDHNVDKASSNPDSILQFYRKLLQFRKGNIDFINGKFKIVQPEHPQVIAITRIGQTNCYLSIMNMSEQAAEFKLPEKFCKESELLFSNTNNSESKLKKQLNLKAWEAVLYKIKSSDIHKLYFSFIPTNCLAGIFLQILDRRNTHLLFKNTVKGRL